MSMAGEQIDPWENQHKGLLRQTAINRNPGNNLEVGVPGAEGRRGPHGASVEASASRGSVWGAGEGPWPGHGQPHGTRSVLSLECRKGERGAR